MERASLGCSRVRRGIPSGLNQQWPETGRIALSSECSYRFVVCMSRVMASRSSRSGRGARCARGKRVLTHSSDQRHAETDAAAPNKTQGQDLGMGAVTAFFSRRESACRRDSARECVLRRPYPGRRWACSMNEVRPFLCEEKPPPTKYEGRAVESGSESGMTGFARTTASEVPGRRVPPPLRPSCEGEGEVSRSMARAESDPYRTRVRRRSRPSEERRCLPPHGRANGPCGGRKRRRYVMPPCTGKVVGSLG
jgi:hypothetical protein